MTPRPCLRAPSVPFTEGTDSGRVRAHRAPYRGTGGGARINAPAAPQTVPNPGHGQASAAQLDLDLAALADPYASRACVALYTPAGRANSSGPDPKTVSSAITAPRACRRVQAAGYGESGTPHG